jgi:hypothetical protein
MLACPQLSPRRAKSLRFRGALGRFGFASTVTYRRRFCTNPMSNMLRIRMGKIHGVPPVRVSFRIAEAGMSLERKYIHG